uniref:TM2 domain-containing protein C02F513 (Trinotate prediction) n=1 Tax=Henneguya salminicola TaxID=69463 RepID=A0A6G3MKK3_HENSL
MRKHYLNSIMILFWIFRIEVNSIRNMINCKDLPKRFFECERVEIIPKKQIVNKTNQCHRPVSPRYENMTFVDVSCQLLAGIQCNGDPMQIKTVPCIEHGVKSYQYALLFSIFMGFTGADRLYLGHISIGVLKLLTGGVFGILWVTDIIQILIGWLISADNRDWLPCYI